MGAPPVNLGLFDDFTVCIGSMIQACNGRLFQLFYNPFQGEVDQL